MTYQSITKHFFPCLHHSPIFSPVSLRKVCVFLPHQSRHDFKPGLVNTGILFYLNFSCFFIISFDITFPLIVTCEIAFDGIKRDRQISPPAEIDSFSFPKNMFVWPELVVETVFWRAPLSYKTQSFRLTHSRHTK